jgi:hypothetical protein
MFRNGINVTSNERVTLLSYVENYSLDAIRDKYRYKYAKLTVNWSVRIKLYSWLCLYLTYVCVLQHMSDTTLEYDGIYLKEMTTYE